MHHQVDETEEIGVQTNVKLKAQTEQMKAINDDVNTVQARARTHSAHKHIRVNTCVNTYATTSAPSSPFPPRAHAHKHIRAHTRDTCSRARAPPLPPVPP